MKTFTVYRRWLFNLKYIGFPVLLLGATAAALIASLSGTVDYRGNPIPAGVIMTAATIFVLYKALHMPQVIEWTDSDRVRFIAPARKVEVAPFDIQTIRPRWYLLEFRWRDGSVNIEHSFNGLSELVSLIRQHNSSVVVKGI